MSATLESWLDTHAQALDAGTGPSDEVLSRLAAARLPGIGVPRELGGEGGTVRDAIEAIAAVAARSLTVAFMLWGHRAFISYVQASPNAALRETVLRRLIAGELAGATGLSNAMKFLSGIESLAVLAAPGGNAAAGWRLDGQLPWVTNLRPEGFIVAAAVQHDEADGGVSIFALPSDAPGVTRSPDLDLIALRGSHTAAIAIERVELGPEWLLHDTARAYLPAIRPAFLGLQCGLAIGLARRSLEQASRARSAAEGVLRETVDALRGRLDSVVAALYAGIADGSFASNAVPLFEQRIALAGIAQEAVEAELQASGGRGYLRESGADFARRWREAAFLPIVTPSLLQLRTELARHAARTERA
ncbi:acyl-CoA dehydrogenase family protein [Chitinasiproducens palmae]|uniref:Acyl-CoA dehydrogenase n=1 Tax=Chitinasiproducens palmae TaxID=1770053 RepID=A0A1H2PP71_9BURK|nr:acyl-CoA dehydrogenase family protein [Chitinasiproducens palmae]SDV48054.1 Acyl-CoA dehydrogenase [Chitinasiproducens palmae]